MSRRPSLAREASALLGRPVGEFIAERRANSVAWRFIARELLDATDGEVDTTEVSLRAWLRSWEAEQHTADVA
jgi:hypothetical protein